MTMILSEEQIRFSAPDAHCETEISKAIQDADNLAQRGTGEAFVVQTKREGISVYTEFLMRVRTEEIVKIIYSTITGFQYAAVA